MKHKRFLIITMVFCVIIFITLNTPQSNFTIFAAIGGSPQNVNNVTVSDMDFIDTSIDPSFVKSDSSNTYSVSVAGKQQSFVINGYYGPNPCSPIGEGGNAYYAVNISTQASIYDSYLYVPKNIGYKIELYDIKDNLLKTIQGASIAEYKTITSGSTKKIIGWIYGFFKPEEIKSQIGMRRIKMSYNISFALNDPAQIIQSGSPANMPFSLFTSSTQTQTIGLSPIAHGPENLGYPVDIVSGNLVENSVDMSLPGGLAITRYYNSGMGYQPGKAFGWIFNFEEFLRFDPDGSVFYRDNTFKEYRFAPDPNSFNNYLPAKAGNFLRLAKDSDGNYAVTFKNQTKKVFNTLGLLIKTIDANGNITSYVWDLPINQINAIYDIPQKLLAVMGPSDSFRANRTLTITNPYGRSVYVNFNRFGRVARVTDWSGTSAEYKWDDTQGIYLLQYKDTAGNYTTFSYDGNNYNKLVSVNYPDGAQIKNYYLNSSSQTVDHQDLTTGGSISYSYGWLNSSQQMYTTVNVNGKIKTYYYDENGTITKITSPGPSNNQIVYGFGSDKNKNLLTTITDALGRITTYYYDGRGNVTEITLANGKSVKFIYDDNNRLTDYCDIAGRHIIYEYDNKNNLTSVKRQDGVRIFFEYDSRGNVIKLTDANGHIRTYEYGAYGDLARTTDEEGGVTKFYHDALGRIAQIDENGSIFNIKYNNSGLVTQMIDGLNNTTNLYYDNNGNLASITDAKNNTTTFDHNALNRLIRYTDPENNSASYRYDTNGKMIGITDPMGGDIGFEYNEGSYLSCARNQNFNRTYYNYDNVGNLTLINNSLASKSTGFAFDNLNRVIQKTGSDTDYYEYDNAGNVKKIRDNSGETLYEYDAMDRLIKKIYPSGKEFSRGFDNNGNIIYEKHVNGDQINYRYDKSDNLISIEKSGTDSLICKYNQGRELASVEYPNKVTEYISYNENKDVVRIKYISSTGEVIYQVDYAYNELGQVSGKQSFGVGRAKKDISYFYDKTGRLIQIKSGDRIISEYSYDRNGNRLTSKTPRGKVNYSYNSANQLIKENQTPYFYDDAGNLTFMDAGNSSRTYAYDKENNLTSATLPSGKKNVENYNYDAYNLRTNKTFLDNTASSYWFNNELTAELDKSGDVSFINYGYGFKNTQGDYYYITDQQGSVMALADKSGKAVTVYEYDEFGNPISSVNVTTSENLQQLQAGTTQPKSIVSKIVDFIKNLFSFGRTNNTSAQSGTSAQKQVVFNKVESPVRFAGYYFDKKTSLYYVKSRYYDPEAGRFTQPDKISYSGGLNLYAYCGNDPVNYIDPNGTNIIGSGIRFITNPRNQKAAENVIEKGANALSEGQKVNAIKKTGGALERGGRQLTQEELWGLANDRMRVYGNQAQALIFIPGLGAVPPETARLYIQADRQAGKDLQTMRTGLDIASFIPGPAGWFSAGLSFLTGLDFNLGANPNKQPLSFPDFLDPTQGLNNFNIAGSGAVNGPIGPGTGTGASTGSKSPAAVGSEVGIIPAGGGTTIDNSRIVFTTNRYSQGYSPRTDVCFMRSDGSNVNKFTYGSWQGTDGAICKTNPHLLAFASDHHRRGSGKRNIYLLDLRDWGIGDSVRLTYDNNIDEYACAFRPDGAGVAFEERYPPGPGASTYGIFYVDIKTLKQTNLNNQSVYHNNRTPRFNPANSNQLIYSSQVSSASSPWGIYMINNLDLNTATLVSPSNLYPVISPDGRKIAFTYPSDGYGSSSSMSGVKDIYIMDIGGGNLKQLTFGLTCWHPVFSPDGNWIAFTNIIHLPNGRVPSKIYKVKIDGTSLTNIDPFPGVNCMNYVNDWGNLSTVEDEWE